MARQIPFVLHTHPRTQTEGVVEITDDCPGLATKHRRIFLVYGVDEEVKDILVEIAECRETYASFYMSNLRNAAPEPPKVDTLKGWAESCGLSRSELAELMIRETPAHICLFRPDLP